MLEIAVQKMDIGPMKRIVPLAALIVAAMMNSPAFAQSQGRSDQGLGNGSSGAAMADGQILSTAEAGPGVSTAEAGGPAGVAEDLRLKGKCDEAIPILRRLIENGAGYEIAQFDLGMCLFDLAKAEHDAQHAADLRQEGASSILSAANAGFGKAENEAVLVYLDGIGVAADPVEAEKWALIYHSNSMRMAIGLPDVAPAIRDRLDAVLTDASRNEAQSRADGWKQTAQSED